MNALRGFLSIHRNLHSAKRLMWAFFALQEMQFWEPFFCVKFRTLKRFVAIICLFAAYRLYRFYYNYVLTIILFILVIALLFQENIWRNQHNYQIFLSGYLLRFLCSSLNTLTLLQTVIDSGTFDRHAGKYFFVITNDIFKICSSRIFYINMQFNHKSMQDDHDE
jgi:hypothetical protein